MLTPPPVPFVDPSLSLAGQQAQILGLITSLSAAPAGDLPGDALTLGWNDAPDLMRVPVAEELKAAEDSIVDNLAEVVAPETGPRVLLFGPGTSKTDPLYALRFMAKLAIRTGRAGEATVYDMNDNPIIRPYYERLPWGPHRARLELGMRANFEQLRGGDAHLILSIHPSVALHTLFESFAGNLVRGGIGLVQASVPPDFSKEEDYMYFVRTIMDMCQGSLELFQPPLRSRLFRSYFSERSSDVHVMAVRRK